MIKKYHIIVFGCQMNYADAERVSAVLSKAGYRETKNKTDADIIAVVMCSIRQSAVDRIHWLVEKFSKLQITNHKLQIVLTGCILEKDKKVFVDGFDYVIDIKNISQLPALIKKSKIRNNAKDYLDIAPKNFSEFSANIPIMTGCNNFCAYCVVPYTREREISRPASNIIREIKNLVKNNYKELWLLGQNVNSYKSNKITFAKLLLQINKIPGDFWIRYTSSHPKDFTNDVIDAMADLPAQAGGKHITPYLNLPVQSGDDRVLRSMKRWYTVKQYKNIIRKLRKKIPNIAISTDIIVGFPGETKKQFNNTVKLFKDIKFDMAYINKYSPRYGTAAARLRDNVSWPEKKRREKVLTDTLRKVAFENNKKLLGKTVRVLIDHKKNNVFFGKTDTYKSIKIQNSKIKSQNLIGQFVNVKITKANNWNLEGKIYEQKNNLPAQTGKLVVILGPTASGKTALSVKFARKFNGEIISADSRQVYKGLDIGSGKVTKKEMQGIPHYLLDVASPKKRFSVAQYQKMAQKVIKKIHRKNKTPFLVGGTGFYIQSIVDNIVLPEVKPNWALRKKLETKSAKELFAMLQKLDPVRAQNIDRYNPRRLLRALEIVISTGSPVQKIDRDPTSIEILQIGIKKDRKELAKLIKRRLLARLKNNAMINEVKKLHKQGLSWERFEELGLEYKFVAQYLQNEINFQEMQQKIQIESEHFAKRQMTWFGRDKRIKWVYNHKQAAKLVESFLHLPAL